MNRRNPEGFIRDLFEHYLLEFNELEVSDLRDLMTKHGLLRTESFDPANLKHLTLDLALEPGDDIYFLTKPEE